MTEIFSDAGGFIPFKGAALNKRAAVPHSVFPGSMKDKNQPGRGSVYRYPEDVGNVDQGHYIIFDIMKQDPNKLKIAVAERKAREALAAHDNPQVGTTGIASTSPDLLQAVRRAKAVGTHKGANSIQVANKATTQLTTSIALYMPPSVQATYSAKYADQDIGRWTETGSGIIRAFSEKGMTLEGAGEAVGKGAAGLLGGGMSSVLAIAPQGTKAIAEIEMGAIITPRMELMFEGIQRRDFSFNFQFVPKTPNESATVKEIVKMFKYHMAADYKNPGSRALFFGGSYLGGSDGVRNMSIPDFFDITYMFQNGPNPYLNKIKRCVLQRVDVTYGDDRFKAYSDGAPQTTKLALSFQELEIITKSYIDEGF